MGKQVSSKKTYKSVYLLVGLTVFVLMGVGLFFVNHGSPPRPSLNAGYKFLLGVSAKDLDLSGREINELNRCFGENKGVVDKAILVIVTEGSPIIGDTPLEYKVVLEGKGGMKFTPQMNSCSRKKLVDKIVYNFDRGCKALAVYINDPDLKNRAVEIIDM